MNTHRTTDHLVFEGLGRRSVVGAFDGGRLTSDSGVLLLREADRLFGVTARLAACFCDHRDRTRVEHGLPTLIAQRVLGLAMGYEDLNDHDRLRDDSALALASGCTDVSGEQRVRERDRGHALAGSSTLNRLELGEPATAECDRYKKIVADGEKIDTLLVDLFLHSERRAPQQVVLDLDVTDDALHGTQEGRFFHGYYGHYCYLPLYLTCGEHVLRCRLRRADGDPSDGAVEELAAVVAQIRQRWADTKILVRGDSGFCREQIMAWCEGQGVDYVLGLARNARLQKRIDKALRKSRRRGAATGQASRRFREFRYRTLNSWSRCRRVVAKAEWLPGAGGGNPRFVVTSLDRHTIAKQVLYEQLYCARGDMENRIKEQQLWLFADRTSAATMRANQLRLYFSAFAGILMTILRRAGLQGTALADARFDTIRSRLIKLAGRITVSVRRVRRSIRCRSCSHRRSRPCAPPPCAAPRSVSHPDSAPPH